MRKKRILFSLFAAVFALSLTAFTVSVLPIGKPRAESAVTTLTLPENTAEYTIEKIDNGKDSNKLNWEYDQYANVWKMNLKDNATFRDTVPTITAKVTKAGTVAFEYLIEFDPYNALDEAKNIAQNKFEFTVTPKNGGDARTYSGKIDRIDQHDFNFVSFEVNEGDTIEFKIQAPATNSFDSGKDIPLYDSNFDFYLHGLSTTIAEGLLDNAAEDTIISVSDDASEVREGGKIVTSGEWETQNETMYVFPDTASNKNWKMSMTLTFTDTPNSNTYTYTYSFQVPENSYQNVSFKYWYWAVCSGMPSGGMGVVLQPEFEKVVNENYSMNINVDGDRVVTKNGLTSWLEDPTYTPTGTNVCAEEKREWSDFSMLFSEGSHTIVINISAMPNATCSIGDPATWFLNFCSAFGVRDFKQELPETYTVTFPSYANSIRKFYTVGGVTTEIPLEGTAVTLPKGVKVDVTAEARDFASFSGLSYALVRQQLYYTDRIAQENDADTFTVEGDMTVTDHFSVKQEAPKPIVWAQVIETETGTETDEAYLVYAGSPIMIPKKEKTTLRFFFADYKDQKGTYKVRVNGKTVQVEDVSQFEQVQIPVALKDSEVYCWVYQNPKESQEIEVTYEIGGYTPHTVVYRTEFEAEQVSAPTQTSGANIFNNLFTSESNAGAYFYPKDSQDVRTTNDVFYAATPMGEGFTVAVDSSYWGYGHRHLANTVMDGNAPYVRYATLAFGNNSDGLFTFEVKLSGAENAANHAGVMMGMRTSDAANALGPTKANWPFSAWKNTDLGTEFSNGAIYDNYLRLLEWTEDGAREATTRTLQEKKLATVTALEDGWYRITLPTSQIDIVTWDSSDSQREPQNVNYKQFMLVFLVEPSYDAKMEVRNFTFIQASDVEIKTKTSLNHGSVKADGLDEQNKAAFGSTVTFTADPDDKKLYGWTVATKKDNKTVSETFYPVSDESNTFEYFAVQSAEITAWIADKEYYKVYLAGTLYNSLNKALTVAKQAAHKTVVALDSFTEEGSVEIPQGVTFLIPFESSGAFMRIGGNLSEIAWRSSNDPKYLTVTLNGDVTVQGSILVGGMFSYSTQSYQGHTSGAYSELIVNGNMTVESGGIMDIYGRITGRGTITALKGAKISEPFLILDFSGGNNTLALFNNRQTPFKRYAMINIQCKLVINQGAQLYGHAILYALNSYFSLDQPFISDEHGGGDTFVMLKDDANVTIEYDDSKEVKTTDNNGTTGIGLTKMTFDGGASFSYMKFSSMGLSIPTSGVDFSIPYNFHVVLKNGQYETKTKFKLMPGSVMEVEKDASLTLNDDTYVYDGLVQSDMSNKFYPSADNLAEGKYATNANLIVNGTLILKSSITFLGVVQTSSTTGKIIVEKEVTLSGTIVDGALTGYDCNTATFESSMRLYDKAHNVLASVPVNKDGKAETTMTFTSTWTDNDLTWTLGGVDVTYAANLGEGDVAAENLPEVKNDEGKIERHGHKWATGSTQSVSTMLGSWMVEHDMHKWSPPQNLTNEQLSMLNSQHYLKVDFGCDVFGCMEKHENCYLLSIPEKIGSVVYEGRAFNGDDAEIKAMLEKYISSLTRNGSVTLSAVITGGARNVDEYDISVSLSENAMWYRNGTYSVTADTNFSVEKATLTVVPTIKHSKQGEELDRSPIEFTLSGIQNGDTSEALRNAIKDKLNVDYINDMRDVDVYSLTVTFTGTLDNYTVVCNKLTYVVTPKTTDVTMTAKKKSWTYGDTLEWKSEEDWLNAFEFTGECVSKKIKTVGQYTIDEVLSKPLLDAGEYTVIAEVTVKYSSEGAEVEFSFPVSAQLHVDQKPVTVKITDLRSEYGDPILELKWEPGEEYSLVDGDDVSVLGIILTKDPGVNVGKYAIKGTSSSKNYKVTFIEGTYTITQKDISKEINISVAGADEGRVQYTGKNISVTASAKQSVKFEITIKYNNTEVSALNKIGAYTVSATVNDLNYSGKKEETFTVYHIKGYTQAVVDQLEKVTELCKKIKSADKLTADNFDAVKSIWVAYALREDLTAEAKANLDKDLEPYMPLLERWNKVADKAENTDYSQVIKTADSVADSPLSGLFVVTALSVLAALLIGGKRR